ncbi:MAG: methyltransferase domain-containing protein [Steroidobacteraceae bacterium]
MHPSALRAGRLFFEIYGQPNSMSILDVGSLDVNGTLRAVAPPGCHYVGADLEPGAGVDVVLSTPHTLPFESETFDAVVSTSCFEHDRLFWLTFLECVRVLKKGGYMYLNAPSNGVYHRYPVDCWRFYPDAGLALAEWAVHQGLQAQVAESFLLNQIDDIWNDFVCVFARCEQGKWPPRINPGHIHSHFSAATNVWVAGAPEVQRFEFEPEDMRRLKALQTAGNPA